MKIARVVLRLWREDARGCGFGMGVLRYGDGSEAIVMAASRRAGDGLPRIGSGGFQATVHSPAPAASVWRDSATLQRERNKGSGKRE